MQELSAKVRRIGLYELVAIEVYVLPALAKVEPAQLRFLELDLAKGLIPTCLLLNSHKHLRVIRELFEPLSEVCYCYHVLLFAFYRMKENDPA